VAVPNAMKVPVPFDYIFPAGALFLGVEPATDFEKRGQGDDQLRDKELASESGWSRCSTWTSRRAASAARRK
jgi:hypothetical protein